ncbi:hypothetical protein SLEP1_g48793 [Rubroshorea leprosula]|uniref:Uncharacterized protein n=1 Tax=Rubroshorea leprosula TaxID=152421 RepID=A0AAV5LXM2_9ROSI|nr:hypothetical protein SLEP1_g48793 [Rubroshorea leprosula]
MAYHHSLRSQSSFLSSNSEVFIERVIEEPLPVTTKTAQSTVQLVYRANIASIYRNVTILWCKNLMNYSLSVLVNSIDGDHQYTCKIDLKPWHFWSKKGYKSFDVEGTQVDVYWDLRSAKFKNGTEPTTDYYVAVVADDEVVLLLGDYKKKAYKRTKCRPTLVDPVLFYKKENVYAKKSFSTRARFDQRRKEHEIIVESSTIGPKDPEMWISIDGIVLVHIRNLQWKFRGNQTVMVDKQPVQVLWDVHDWLFGSLGVGNGLFIFKPMATESESDVEGSGHGGDSDTSTGSRYYSTKSTTSIAAADFCLFLYAWKIE